MEKLEKNCRALFDVAFPGEDAAWCDALFAYAVPNHLRVIAEGDKPQAMLFALPYDIQLPDGSKQAARYLYAVATDPAYRGQGIATKLLRAVAAEGIPFFLRPMSPSLFEFYRKVGLSPVSPMRETAGESAAVPLMLTHLSAMEYLVRRKAFLRPPYAEPTAEFLSLGFRFGGAVAGDGFVTYYEKNGDEVRFKEWLGTPDFAPAVAAALGATHYKLRTPCMENEADSTCFAMAVGCPVHLAFLIALD